LTAIPVHTGVSYFYFYFVSYKKRVYDDFIDILYGVPCLAPSRVCCKFLDQEFAVFIVAFLHNSFPGNGVSGFQFQFASEGKDITVFIPVPQPNPIIVFVENVVCVFFVLKR